MCAISYLKGCAGLFFFILTLGLSLKRNIHIIRRQAQIYSAVRSFEHKATGQAIGQRIERIGVL